MIKILSKIKIYLSKYKIGKLIILFYHYIISVPLLWVSSLKYLLIKKMIVKPVFYQNDYVFNEIKNNKKSLSRFGDGEISWIFGESKGSFNQKNSKVLSEKLKEVIDSKNKNIFIAIPDFFENDLKHYSLKRRISRNAHLASSYKKWGIIIDKDRKYADALITRVYLGLRNTDSEKLFSDWKNTWSDRNVVIIEGEQTRFGVGNNLLDNVRSLTRIIAPSENAFSKYDSILATTKKHSSDDTLFLISLGPTASILAYDLSILGHQAIDIGHLDIEYEWFLKKAKKKISIKGKYVNEAGGSSKEELSSELINKYNSEIVEKI